MGTGKSVDLSPKIFTDIVENAEKVVAGKITHPSLIFGIMANQGLEMSANSVMRNLPAKIAVTHYTLDSKNKIVDIHKLGESDEEEPMDVDASPSAEETADVEPNVEPSVPHTEPSH